MTSRFTRTAITLHWLIALGLAGTFVLGLYMSDLPLSPHKLKLFSWHKWAGVTLFALALVRLGWRFGHPAPALPASMPPWQARAAQGMHALLYLLMFAIPLVGWLMSSAKGFTTVWFGILPLPDLLAKNADLGHLLANAHAALAWTLVALMLAHAGAAIKHHVIDKDDVLARMLPFLKS